MFEWDINKNRINTEKHGVAFEEAIHVFNDPHRLTIFDVGHSQAEDRYLCVGKVDGEVITVRFTLRNGFIRIIGAGYWRKGRRLYETKN